KRRKVASRKSVRYVMRSISDTRKIFQYFRTGRASELTRKSCNGSSSGARGSPAVLRRGRINPLGGPHVQGGRDGVRQQQVQRRQGRQGRYHFNVSAAGVTEGRPVAPFLAFVVQEPQLFVAGVAAKRTPEPRHRPARRAQAAAQKARLVQAAELPQ